ncbi:MAG: DNA polymerase III subunit alpha [Bacilli bacterium]|nr:DNA polymerase III subunit alpha [Bacilli bacterium]
MFVNLGIKTDFSLFKSLIKLDDLFIYAKKNNIQALGILDDNLNSSHLFIEGCKKNGIKGVVGLDKTIDNIRLFLYPINFDGLKLLFKLEKYSIENEIKINDLEKFKDNIICVIPYESINSFKVLSSIYDDVYLSYKNKRELDSVSKLTNNYIYINDTLAFTKEASWYINYLNMIDKGLKLGEYEFKDYSDNIFKNLRIDCSDFVNKINIEFKKDKNHIPKFKCEGDSFTYLKELSFKGLNKRLNNNITKEYEDRLNYELDIINKMGYVDYFLIVFDYVRYALKNKIFVGCGRGSAVGSLVSYSLGISWIDPIKYGLIFERFLNPERVTMPDIDVDFEDERREEVIDYVRDTYGKNKVSNIIAYGTFTAKDVIRTVAKLNNIDEGAIESLTKVLDSKLSLKNNLNNSEVASIVKRNSSLRKVYEDSKYLEGLKSRITVHAAGIVISDEDLTENIPVVKNGDVYLSGYQKDELESLGILKMDFLSVTDLTIVRKVNELIKEHTGKEINLNYLDLCDKKTYELISNGDTSGVFQIKTPMMKNYLRKAKVKEFKDLVMTLAINRPGPMTQIPLYLDRKNNGKKIEYIIDDLKPILEETYGIMIYQEQVMEVFRKLAGYSFSEADLIRRAISKKKIDIIESSKQKFIESSVKNGYDKEKIEKVYDMIVEFADYGFNKSHSVAYSYIAYQMAYLKANYPLYFYLVSLGYGAKSSLIINEAKAKGIEFLKPDINKSSVDYVIDGEKIILPFKAIKGITENICKIIIDARGNKNYSDIYDFFGRVKGISKKILTTLIEAGIFDSLNIARSTLIRNLDSLITYGELIQTLSSDLVQKPELINVDEYDDSDLIKKELDLYGFFINKHPCCKYNTVKQMDISKYFNKIIDMTVLVNRISKIKTKNNTDMAFITYEDETGIGEAIVFSDQFKLLDNVKEKNIIKVKARVERRNDKYQVIVQNLEIAE